MIKIFSKITTGSLWLILGMALVYIDIFTLFGAVLAIHFLMIAAVGLFYRKGESYEQSDEEFSG